MAQSRREDEHVLVVVAHPDDEVLGFGGTAAVLARDGVRVTACILSGDVTARHRRPADAELLDDTLKAADLLGMQPPIMGGFPNIRLNTVPHLDLVQFIEGAILATEPGHVFTHHVSDVNDDHRQVSLACQAAIRVSQRRAGLPRLRSAHLMEIPSSTDWSFPGSQPPFSPNAFCEIGAFGLERKLSALAAYRDVMRPYPHPRSEEVVRGLATYRGGHLGMKFAEAFQTVQLDLWSLVSKDV